MASSTTPTAFHRGIWRTIRGSLKRYLSILTITALGVSIMIGLNAGCEDLRASVDAYFDQQHVYDISIQSTLGLTGDDVKAVSKVSGVESAEGIYSETAYTTIGSQNERVNVQSLSKNDLDQPVIVEGSLPDSSSKVAVTERFLKDSGKKIGDTLTFSVSKSTDEDTESDTTEIFEQREYTICGSVLDPTDIMPDTTTNSFRATSLADYSFYVTESAATSTAFTAIHLSVESADELDCYSNAYDKLVSQVKQKLEDIASKREEARTKELREDSSEEIDTMERAAKLQFTLQRQKLARLPEGSAERTAGEAALSQQEAETEAQIAEARAQLADIDDAVWYIQDRSNIASFASVDSDSSSIQAIATVFPLIFFVVAVLISLTTATRMVEEERTLIGLYKALSYSRRSILSKYIIYSLSACLLGGAVGCLIGFIALPEFLFMVFRQMYDLPTMLLKLDLVRMLVSIGLFAAGITGATWIACRNELSETPAALMRPRAPRAGSRILLERIRPLWRRMGFLNKVTARNLFRYKKRAFMTIFGIAGCTALVICGIGIRDTVVSLSPKQYGGVTRYDLMAVASASDFSDLADNLAKQDEVEDELRVQTDSVSVEYQSEKETVQLVVIPTSKEDELDSYVRLADEDEQRVNLSDTGVVITKSASMVLGTEAGDTITVQNSALKTADLTIASTAMSYLGNTIYMTQELYEQAFDTSYAENAVLAHLSGTSEEQIEFCEQASQDGWLSCTSTAAHVRDFEQNFAIVNAVVVLITVMAACLSFVVVFTLSTTNISERERELATIKVLGFKAPEVHHYVNKETLVLTAMGAAIGIPLGYVLAESFTYVLQMPSLYFDVEVAPVTYIIAVALSFAFTIVVNLVTNRSLDRIDMVGALKSAE